MAQEQEPKTHNAVVKVEKTPLFSLRDKLIYAFGFIAFILGGPAVMAYLAAWSPEPFILEALPRPWAYSLPSGLTMSW